MTKLGYVKQHFGVVFKSALTTYLEISKSFPSFDVLLIDVGERVTICDIAIFNGVATYLKNVSLLNSDMIAVVCGGPLQINDLESIIPLDYTKTLSYEFCNTELNLALIKQARKSNDCVQVKNLNADHLLLIVDSLNTEGILLTDYNKITSILNMTSRNNFRAKIAQYFHTGQLFSAQDIVPDMNKDLEQRVQSFIRKLKSSKGQTLVRVVRQVLNGSNLKSIARKNNVTEFELLFFKKMIQSQKDYNSFTFANKVSTINTKVKTNSVSVLKKARKHIRENQA